MPRHAPGDQVDRIAHLNPLLFQQIAISRNTAIRADRFAEGIDHDRKSRLPLPVNLPYSRDIVPN
jgi:hypothetical protein